MQHLYNIQTEVTVWYSVWQRPNMHPVKMPAVFYLYMFLQNIFITETNNYSKRILQSHIDHYHNSRATNWKKLTTEGLNRFIACHRYTQMKNKSHMLVCKNPSQHCPCFHNISKSQFPLKPGLFSHGSQERFCYFP